MNRYVPLLSLLFLGYITVFGEDSQADVCIGLIAGGGSAIDMASEDTSTCLPEINSLSGETKIHCASALTEAASSCPEVPGSKPLHTSIHTNILYDLLLLPNIGAELYLGKNWSVAANWMYGWWDKKESHHYWRAYGGMLAVRRWFGRAAKAKPLTGHHLGAYGQLLTYDFQFGGKGQMGGEPGKPLWHSPSYAAGVEYGYAMPVARRLNIDFTIGVGYFGGKYYEYEPIDNHDVWQSTKQRQWFGPTKAEISLVWLIGHGNRNERK